jgi:hypothetical protein
MPEKCKECRWRRTTRLSGRAIDMHLCKFYSGQCHRAELRCKHGFESIIPAPYKAAVQGLVEAAKWRNERCELCSGNNVVYSNDGAGGVLQDECPECKPILTALAELEKVNK